MENTRQIKFRGETLQRVKTTVMPSGRVKSQTGRSRYKPHVGEKEQAKKGIVHNYNSVATSSTS